jgi:hypothetical protein
MINSDGGDQTAAYLHLIEEILLCKDGEQVALLLEKNYELVDQGFVKTLAQVAQLMVENGQPDSAAILINMATEISAVIEEG